MCVHVQNSKNVKVNENDENESSSTFSKPPGNHTYRNKGDNVEYYENPVTVNS
jgi:hypothetical protein